MKVLQHLKNYVSTSVKKAKEIFPSIFIALNPNWVPRSSNYVSSMLLIKAVEVIILLDL